MSEPLNDPRLILRNLNGNRLGDERTMTEVLHLTLHRKWFADIFSKKKRIEYRNQKPHWSKS